MTSPLILVDGNNLGHVLGYIDKARGHYDIAGLLATLDDVARHLISQGQAIEIKLFLDDKYAHERLGGWHVQVAPVPEGDADKAIRAFARAHAQRPQILVSGDQELCARVMVWGTICLAPRTFIAHYLLPARRGGSRTARQVYVEESPQAPAAAPKAPRPGTPDLGEQERQRQAAALARAQKILRGEPLPEPEDYRLNLEAWTDEAELALYLADRHLCPVHEELTDPSEMIRTICNHCSQEPRYFTAGPVVDRVFRLFLCRAEHTLSIDDLAHLAQTRRSKIKTALKKYGDRLGIVVAW